MTWEWPRRPSWRAITRGVARRPLLTLLLLLPFVGVLAMSRAVVTPLAKRLALPVDLAAHKIDALPKQREPTPLPPTPEAEAIARLDGKPSPPKDRSPAPAGLARGGTPKALPAIGILVSRKRVQAAIDGGIRPSGTPVAATPWRPAGLALAGVSALGVGLRDGDVLVRAGGTPARSDGAVIGAVRGALQSKAKAISGEVWRGQRRIIITVELPKMKRRRPPRPADRRKGGEGQVGERKRPKHPTTERVQPPSPAARQG